MFARLDKLEEPSTKTQKVCPDLCMNLKQAHNLHHAEYSGNSSLCQLTFNRGSWFKGVSDAECQLRSRQTVLILSQTMWNKCEHLAEKIDKDSLQSLLKVFENPR